LTKEAAFGIETPVYYINRITRRLELVVSIVYKQIYKQNGVKTVIDNLQLYKQTRKKLI